MLVLLGPNRKGRDKESYSFHFRKNVNNFVSDNHVIYDAFTMKLENCGSICQIKKGKMVKET